MKAVIYAPDALRDLKRHGNVAKRIRKKVDQYAADPASLANQVITLQAASGTRRLRVGAFRAVFVEDATAITVVRVGPRGGVYD